MIFSFRLPRGHLAASREERAGLERAGHTPREARPEGAELHERSEEASRVEPLARPLTLPRSRLVGEPTRLIPRTCYVGVMAERGVQTDQQARNGDPSAVASKSAKALPPRPRHTSRERAREAYESRPRDGDELAARATTFPTAPAQFLFDAVAFLDQDLLQGGFSIRRRRQITHFIAVEIEKMYAAIGEVERQLVDVLFNLHTLYSKKVGQHEDIEFSSLSDENHLLIYSMLYSSYN